MKAAGPTYGADVALGVVELVAQCVGRSLRYVRQRSTAS